MIVTNVLAVVPVSDMDAAETWYERLLGRPADNRPMPGLADWHLTDGGWMQIFHDAGSAGSTSVNLVVADLPTAAEEITGRGLGVDEIVEASAGVRLLPIADPDGNTITLIENLRVDG